LDCGRIRSAESTVSHPSTFFKASGLVDSILTHSGWNRQRIYSNVSTWVWSNSSFRSDAPLCSCLSGLRSVPVILKSNDEDCTHLAFRVFSHSFCDVILKPTVSCLTGFNSLWTVGGAELDDSINH
jgi:hypothetical protein